jgi:hypothetical protein
MVGIQKGQGARDGRQLGKLCGQSDVERGRSADGYVGWGCLRRVVRAVGMPGVLESKRITNVYSEHDRHSKLVCMAID